MPTTQASVKCLLMRPDTEEVVARIIIDRLVITEQEDRFIIDMEGENADVIVGGNTPADALYTAADSLRWYAEQTLVEGKPFPQLDGVEFQQVAPMYNKDDYDYMVGQPNVWRGHDHLVPA